MSEKKMFYSFCNTPEKQKKFFEQIKVVNKEDLTSQLQSSQKNDLIITMGQKIAIVSDIETLIKAKNRFNFIKSHIFTTSDGKMCLLFISHAPQILSAVLFFLGKKKS